MEFLWASVSMYFKFGERHDNLPGWDPPLHLLQRSLWKTEWEAKSERRSSNPAMLVAICARVIVLSCFCFCFVTRSFWRFISPSEYQLVTLPEAHDLLGIAFLCSTIPSSCVVLCYIWMTLLAVLEYQASKWSAGEHDLRLFWGLKSCWQI